jgi:hypothetical protein
MKTSVLSLAISVLIASAALAGDACDPAQVETSGSPNRCAHCGRHGSCEKYCKIVPIVKEVKKTVFSCKCQDICTMLPGCIGRRCEKCCGECAGDNCQDAACGCGNGKCDPCEVEKKKCLVPPKCGRVRSVNTLQKKEVVCKVPGYKCEVVYCCPSCANKGATSNAPAPAAPKAPAPAPAPKLPSPPKTTDLAPLPPVTTAADIR